MNVLARFLLVLAMALPNLAQGQNLLQNPGFDNDVSAWLTGPPGSILWSMLDASGNPGSGSVELTNASVNPSNGATVTQCIPMPARYAYAFGGKVYVPSGPNQSLTNTARVDMRFSTNAGCTQFSGGSQQIGASASQFDTWQTVGPVVRVAPPGTVAVQVRGLLSKFPAGGSIIANFDDFSAEPDTFFIGDVE